VYGITAHSVAQRRREIGVRIAPGALRHQVLAMTVREAMALTAGAGIGLIVAASLVPAHRAASVNPVEAPRAQ
jgi:ABC-type antimicrobial peptide transport system permease subunit